MKDGNGETAEIVELGPGTDIVRIELVEGRPFGGVFEVRSAPRLPEGAMIERR